MSNRFYIAVNPVGSGFAKALKTELLKSINGNVYRVLPNSPKLQGRSWRTRRGNIVTRPAPAQFKVTQNPLDKIAQFRRFSEAGVSCPNWTTNADDVAGLGSKTVFARTLVNSTNGRGIVEFEVGAAIPRAPLYTAYIPKKAEYRFHVFAGRVIDVQQKRKKRGFENERDTRVRNLHNGYVYCRDGVNPPAGAADLAVAAVASLGYQYGAVDLIYNEKQNKCFVLEVNSRPGLMGTTLKNYADAIINTFNLERK